MSTSRKSVSNVSAIKATDMMTRPATATRTRRRVRPEMTPTIVIGTIMANMAPRLVADAMATVRMKPTPHT